MKLAIVYKLYPNIYLSCKVGYAHSKGLYGLFFRLQLFIIWCIILISANCFAHVHEQSAGSKRGGMVCESLLKPVKNMMAMIQWKMK